MQNVSTLISQACACGHGHTFSSARRPRTREEFGSPFSEIYATHTLMGVISELGPQLEGLGERLGLAPVGTPITPGNISNTYSVAPTAPQTERSAHCTL